MQNHSVAKKMLLRFFLVLLTASILKVCHRHSFEHNEHMGMNRMNSMEKAKEVAL